MWNQHAITLTCCNWVQDLLSRRFTLFDYHHCCVYNIVLFVYIVYLNCCCHFLNLQLIAPKNKANFREVEKTAPLHESISKFMCVQNIAWSLSPSLYISLFLFPFIKKHSKYTHDTKKSMQHTWGDESAYWGTPCWPVKGVFLSLILKMTLHVKN